MTVENPYIWQSSETEALQRTQPDLEPGAIDLYDRNMYAMGTVEPKAAVYLHGLSDIPSRAREVKEELADFVGEDIWVPANTDIVGYLHRSYIPTGLAIAERMPGRRVYFSTTEEGEQYSKGAAALFLKHTAQSGILLENIFGFIGHFHSRAYINRTALLLSLYQESSFTAELALKTGVERGTTALSLRTFHANGLAVYESTEAATTGQIVYERIGEPEAVQRSTSRQRLRENIIEFFKVNKAANVQSLNEALGFTSKADIVTMVSELAAAGYLRRAKWYQGVRQSDAEITQQGRTVVESLVLPLLNAFSNNRSALNSLEAIRQEVENDPFFTSRALEIYRDAFVKNPRSETTERVLDFIREHDQLQAKDLVEEFGKTVFASLRDLLQSKDIERKRRGNFSFYLPAGSEMMELPKKQVSIEYQHPHDLIPQAWHPKQWFLDQFQTREFWSQLIVDLESVPPQEITESHFFRKYDPNNTNSLRKDPHYVAGKYANFAATLQRAGIKKPTEYIRNFTPTNIEDEELIDLVDQAQRLIKDRLRKT